MEPLLPAPSYADLVVAIGRFTKERAPENLAEAWAFATYVKGLAAASAEALAELNEPPSAEEVIDAILRFVAERAPDHPDQFVRVARFSEIRG